MMQRPDIPTRLKLQTSSEMVRIVSATGWDSEGREAHSGDDGGAMKICGEHYGQHLEENDLVPTARRCPVCGREGERRPVSRIQSQPDVDYLRCSVCAACSASAMPTPAFLERYYQQYCEVTDSKLVFSGTERFARNLVRAAPIASSSGRVDILDFGGGDGTLAVTVARQLLDARSDLEKARVLVVDYMESPAPGDEHIEVSSVSNLDQVDGELDLILASAILEHIPDFEETFRALHRRLKPGGVFYTRTPYALPMKRLLSSYPLLFPAHVHDLGVEFWDRVLDSLALPGRVLVSRPSIVETSIWTQPLRASAAYLLKLPARIERAVTGRIDGRLKWKFVGGWEVVLER